jgi:NAD-dependent deacetylase
MEHAAVARALGDARRVLAITGAGMSADSGLPTYRGIGGLYDAIEVEQNLAIEEILHAYTLARNPALAWKYIAQIALACRNAGPHDGHRELARWDARMEVMIATQNVDGFHSAAGSRNVIELHGNFARYYCCACRAPHEMRDFVALPPRCTQCDGLIRPDVVLFGELLPQAAMECFEREIARGFDLILVIGTTAAFPYIFEPVVRARGRGTLTVEINPDTTMLSPHVDHRIVAPARSALLDLGRALP